MAVIASLAIRVHDMEAMKAFYSEAFQVEFHQVERGGLESYFGDLGGVTLKLVPLRAEPDFEGYPLHQPGFRVSNVHAVIDLARQHGGRQEGDILHEGGSLHGAVRDPDGNTVELYSES